MPIFGQKRRFTRKNVEAAPDEAGVYALLAEGEVAYYGSTRGDETIKSRLSEHLWGRQEPGRGKIKMFSFEVTRFPLSRECALLEEHKRNNWRLPAYNRPGVAPAPLGPEAMTA
ncbi:MAG TPA: hypothetical protein VFZ01_07930 [Geminicoccaceae bacterium]